MRRFKLMCLAVLCAFAASSCLQQPAIPAPTSTPTMPVAISTPVPTPVVTLPPVQGSEPSYRVGAFYYPWYRTPKMDGAWDHWEEVGFDPPTDISSDFYPTLGAYSSTDPAVVAQHFAWLREAGVGIIVSSWWGRNSPTDTVLPLLLDMGDRYGIKVAFHIEPYDGRSASRLVEDVEYLYRSYGSHPAFYRTTAESRWSPNERPKGLFYLWAALHPDFNSQIVEPEYWQEALDRIHELPDGGLVLSDENTSMWIDEGHFDGLYNYGVLDIAVDAGYSWARDLPSGAWYVPGINPGFSAQRIGYESKLNTPRRDGNTYEDRWEAALSVDVEPALVTITTFNEWHEGTQIEPAEAGATNGLGYTYQDYGALPPQGYLNLTRKWVNKLQTWNWPETTRLRIHLETSSDWTELNLISGATWMRYELISASESATIAGMENSRFVLIQPIDRALAGEVVELVANIQLADWERGGTVVFEIERGNLGSTHVEISKYIEDETVEVEQFIWGGVLDGRNAVSFQIPADALIGDGS